MNVQGKLELKFVKGQLVGDGSEVVRKLNPDIHYIFEVNVNDSKGPKFARHESFSPSQIEGYLNALREHGYRYSGQINIISM